MTELTDIDGIGPSRAKTLEEEGYGSIEELADADPSELADSVSRVTEDRATSFVLSAENLTGDDDEPSEEEVIGEDTFATDGTETQEADDDAVVNVETAEDAESVLETIEEEEEEEVSEEEEDAEDEPEPPYDVSLEMDAYQEQLFTAALVDAYMKKKRSNKARAEALETILSQAENGTEFELTGLEINTLFSAIRQRKTTYQGKNMIDEMNLIADIQEQVQEYRNEYAF